MTIFKYGIQAPGNASPTSRLRESIQHSICHLRGPQMARGFCQGAIVAIPLYESGIHRPGSRLVTLGLAILSTSTPLPRTLMALSSPPHLMTTKSASGGARIDKPSPYSNTPTQCCTPPFPRMACTSSAEVWITRYQNGQYPRALCQIPRQV